METDDNDRDKLIREVRGRRLLMAAAAIGQNINDLWSIYLELMGVMDMNDPTEHGLMLDMLAEFEYNLHDMLGVVMEQVYDLTGVYEPLPVEQVEDFEASVLRSIGGLGEINLDDYRVELDDVED